jgi:hypothetical protein
MDWKFLLSGILLLITAWTIYNARNWGHYEGEYADGINKMRLFRHWIFIVHEPSDRYYLHFKRILIPPWSNTYIVSF